MEQLFKLQFSVSQLLGCNSREIEWGGCDVGRWLEFKNLVPANQVSTLDRSVAALPIPTAASHTPAVEGRSWEGLVPDCRGSSKGKQQQWFPECGKLGTLVLGPEGF